MKIRRKQRETRTHAAKWLLLVAAAAFCFVAYQGVQGVLHVIDDWTSDLPSLSSTDAFNYAQESTMYAGDQSTLLAEFQLEKRDPLASADQVSPYVLKGTVDTEDVRFYEHTGVDLPGIARAVLVNLGGGALEGASTITQQLVRNTVLSEEANDISFERKIREAQLAVDMEKMYSKDEILLMYLNTINYGDGCYGIEAAAQNYFQVSALDLTLSQAAALVGIPQSPTYLNPKENPEACQERRNVVLDRMLTAGDITQEEHDAAQAVSLEEDLNLAGDPPSQGIYAYPYFTSYVRDLLTAENNPFGLSYADLFEGGYTIYTSLDPAMQEKAEAACAAQNEVIADNLESSIVAVEPSTGYIKALVGGKDYFSNQWNVATQGGQPTGSSFKPFTLAAAIEQGINPATMIDCTNPMTITGGKELWNFGNTNYGIRSIASATTVSSNTGYYRLAEKVTPAAMNEMAQRLGANFETQNLPIATLGTENVTPLDMAKAYATFATGGMRHEAVAVTKIVDKNGNVVYEAPTSDEGERVISEEVAGAVTKVLRTVFESSDGTAYGMMPTNGQPVAGKTGTVQEFRGHWLVGYSPQLSCAAWIGSRNYEQTDEGLTANYLWRDFMSRALAGTEIVQFPETKDPEYKNPFNTEQKEKYAKQTQEEKDKELAAKAAGAVGLSLSDAASLLNGYDVSYTEEYSSSVAAGIVISQSVQNGKIVLVVSKGPKPVDPTPTPTPTPTPDPDPPPNPDPTPDPPPDGTG